MRILLLTAMIIFASSASAGLYKWVDNDGNVHYSQKRPANKQFKRIKAPATAPEGAKSPYKAGSAAAKPSKTLTNETAKNEKIRAKNCTQAKKNLNNFQVHRRMRDKDGNVTVIDNKVRAQQIEAAKKAITNYCE